MNREPNSLDFFESEGLDLQKKMEKLMSWAKSHAKLSHDLLETRPEADHEALKQCFAQSLELGQEIIVTCEQSLKSRGPVRNDLTSPRLEPPRKDLILPLSGSMRFVDPGVSYALAQPMAEETSTRRITLSPSRSYSKKKVY